jgi:hypothetical protein
MSPRDDGAREPEPRDAEGTTLSDLTSVIARRVRYDKPRRFFAGDDEYSESDVIEIDVETETELYVGGTGPALFVGDIPVIDSERVGRRKYRFFAPGSLPLEEGAPIALGRAGSGVPAPERRTKLRLQWTGDT